MWRGGFAVGDEGFDRLKPRFPQHRRQPTLGETEPAVSVEFAGFLEM